jgi:hypothetical protein
MASPSNFFSGLEIHFITKRLVRVEHKILVEKINSFGGAVSDHLNERPRGVNY